VQITTAPLAVKTVPIMPALFKAQLPDTLNVLRQAIPDWTAVHVTGTPGPRGPSKDEITNELLNQLKPTAALYDPIYQLSVPGIPPNTICSLVPDRVRPSFASEYEYWKFIFYRESRKLLKEFFDHAMGGIPDGPVGVGDALMNGKVNGQTALEGWTGSIGGPSFKRTMEAILDPKGKVMFWDTAFGFEGTGETFLKTSDMILGAFGVKGDRLYFDASSFTWFAVFYPGGQMKVCLLG
jgi:hypothetical protein